MKKLIVIFISLFMLIGVFMVNTVGAEDEITLTLWDIRTQSDQVTPAMKDAIERFENDYPNINIEHAPTQNDNYKTKIRTAMSANNEPDIFMTWGSSYLRKYVDNNKVYDLTEHIKNTDWEEKFTPAALDVGEINDKQYGLPITNTAIAVVWYRKDIFEKYNLTPPETYEELLTIVKTLKNNNITPFSLANQTQWTGSMYYMYLADRFGGADVLKNALNREGDFNDDHFIKAGEKIIELVNMGAFPNGVNGMNEDSGQARALLYADKSAMYLMGTWAYGLFKKENENMLNNIGFFKFPEIKGQKGGSNNLIGTPGDNYYSVSKSSENKEAAVKFLKYISDSKMAEELLKIGNIPPFTGIKDKIDDPMLRRIYTTVQEAENIQLWYNVEMPLELAQVHLNTTQALFGNDMSPEKAANEMEAAAEDYFKEN